jgi:hypothetical protein
MVVAPVAGIEGRAPSQQPECAIEVYIEALLLQVSCDGIDRVRLLRGRKACGSREA